MRQAVENQKICGDGEFTKKANSWFENRTGTAKCLMTGRVESEDAQEIQKWTLLQEFLEHNGYELKMDNGVYQIYE